MEFYGDYTPENGQICIPIALAQTLIYFSQKMFPDLQTRVIFEDWISKDANKPGLLGYCPYLPEKYPEDTEDYRKWRQSMNIFVITPDVKEWERFLTKIPPEDFWLHFWTFIAHELRHLIQHKIFHLNEEKMFSEKDLPRFKKLYPKHYPIIEYKYKAYIKMHYPSELMTFEIDAIIISIMNAPIIANALTKDGFDEQKFLNHILAPASTFTDNVLKTQEKKPGRVDIEFSEAITFIIPQDLKDLTAVPEE